MAKSNVKNLPLEWIRVFEAAGRTGSFTAAAKEVGLTQAAVSQRLRNLEQRIGASLFSRQARGVSLTVDGEAWLPHVTDALAALNASSEELFGKPLQKIVISASASITQLWIVPRLSALRAQSNFQISVTTMNINADFAKTNALLEIRYGSGDWPDMRCARLYKEALAPLAAPHLLATSPDWRTLPRIAVAGPRPGWQEWARQSGDTAPPVPNYRFDNFVAAHAAAKAGIGVILGSLPLCASELADKSLVQLCDKTLQPGPTYWMTTKDRLPQNQWETLQECFCDPVTD